jgi:uncharacterized protein (TIGR01319 family)
MVTSIVSADSLLAIDIGTITTRASLFDVVSGRYRFLAQGTSVTTVGAPFKNAGEGVHRAIDQLQETTGWKLVRDDESLITPRGSDGSGVDIVALTFSAGPPLRVVAIGLLEDISLESARRLAMTTYTEVVETLSLNDHRKQDQRIDAIIRARPDVIVVAGGTEGGANQSVLRLVEAVEMASSLLPGPGRPHLLYAGNRQIRKQVQNAVGEMLPLHLAPNVRATLESEQLDAAQLALARILRQIQMERIPGIQEVDSWAGGRLLPTATAFGRVIRFLSKVYDPAKGVLGIEVGAAATTLAAAFTGQLTSGVYTQLGLGSGIVGLLEHSSVAQISRWLPMELSDSAILNYIYNKAAYPASIPATEEELHLEQALARQAIRCAVKQLSPGLPQNTGRPGPDLLPWFEPIMASGSVLNNAPSAGHSLLMLLDGLQPTGVTTIILDENNLAAALGAAAEVNPMLAVQILESNTFVNLGTVISPVGNVRWGTPVLRVHISYEDGGESNHEIKAGTIEAIPLALGKSADLRLQPLQRCDIGMGGAGRGGRLRVVGGGLGVVIDARGRPIEFHPDPARQRDMQTKWLWTLGS